VGEGTLALITIIAVSTVFLTQADYLQSYTSFQVASSQGINHFIAGAAKLAGGVGIPADVSATIIALMIVSFAATTLDSAVRLMRYLIGELGTEYGAPQLAHRHV